MISVSALYEKCEQFCKLAEAEDSNDVRGLSSYDRSEDILQQREANKKYQEIRLMLMEVKRLADIVDYKYKSLGKPSGLAKLFDINYYSTVSSVRKARDILEKTSKGLDKFTWF